MKLGAGYPMGPLQLADYVGLDTVQFILKGWSERYPNEPSFKSSRMLDDLVKNKKFGVKSGAGKAVSFYFCTVLVVAELVSFAQGFMSTRSKDLQFFFFSPTVERSM
jgi:hypothetical protein